MLMLQFSEIEMIVFDDAEITAFMKTINQNEIYRLTYTYAKYPILNRHKSVTFTMNSLSFICAFIYVNNIKSIL